MENSTQRHTKVNFLVENVPQCRQCFRFMIQLLGHCEMHLFQGLLPRKKSCHLVKKVQKWCHCIIWGQPLRC